MKVAKAGKRAESTYKKSTKLVLSVHAAKYRRLSSLRLLYLTPPSIIKSLKYITLRIT